MLFCVWDPLRNSDVSRWNQNTRTYSCCDLLKLAGLWLWFPPNDLILWTCTCHFSSAYSTLQYIINDIYTLGTLFQRWKLHFSSKHCHRIPSETSCHLHHSPCDMRCFTLLSGSIQLQRNISKWLWCRHNPCQTLPPAKQGILCTTDYASSLRTLFWKRQSAMTTTTTTHTTPQRRPPDSALPFQVGVPLDRGGRWPTANKLIDRNGWHTGGDNQRICLRRKALHSKLYLRVPQSQDTERNKSCKRQFSCCMTWRSVLQTCAQVAMYAWDTWVVD